MLTVVAVAVLVILVVGALVPAVLLWRRVLPDVKRHKATRGVYSDDLIGRIERMPVDQSRDSGRKRGRGTSR